MRVLSVFWLCILLVAPLAVALAGCEDATGSAGPPLNDSDPASNDLVEVRGTVTTPLGNRVEGVHVRLFGVSADSIAPVYDQLDEDLTDATGAFSVYHSTCRDYPRYFVDLEIACFPIGLREVGCGTFDFEFIFNWSGE